MKFVLNYEFTDKAKCVVDKEGIIWIKIFREWERPCLRLVFHEIKRRDSNMAKIVMALSSFLQNDPNHNTRVKYLLKEK